MSVQDLRQVGHYIDWDKLHDEYLDAVYTLGDQPEQDSSSSSSSRQQQQRRNLGKKAKSGGANKKKKKRRTKRPRTDSSNRRRKRRQRRHEWDLNEIETDLHQQSEMNVENALPPMPDAHSPPQESSAMNPVNNNGSSSSSGGGRDGGGIVVATTELVPEETTTMASDTTTTTGGGQGRAVGDGRDYVTASDGALVLTVNSDGEFADEEEEESDAARQQLPTDDMFTIGNEGIAIPIYNYTRGNCPDAGSSPRAVPCAPDNLSQICSKYSGQGSFSACFDACRPSFCCVHGKMRLVGVGGRVSNVAIHKNSHTLVVLSCRRSSGHQHDCTELQHGRELCAVRLLLHCVVEAARHDWSGHRAAVGTDGRLLRRECVLCAGRRDQHCLLPRNALSPL